MECSDKELIEGMLSNNERIICHFFFEACTPMFSFIIKKIFDYKVNRNELINELYLYLQENNWHKLRQFDYRSKLTTWLSVAAIRFFQRKRDELIEKESSETLIKRTDIVDDVFDQKFDLDTLINQLTNERYKYVIIELIQKDRKPQDVADEMNVSVDNLYNIKRRAIESLTLIAGKEGRYV